MRYKIDPNIGQKRPNFFQHCWIFYANLFCQENPFDAHIVYDNGKDLYEIRYTSLQRNVDQFRFIGTRKPAVAYTNCVGMPHIGQYSRNIAVQYP